MNTSRVSDPDGLTRTTLLFDRAISALSVPEIKHALQRVPGVLLAEIDGPGHPRATVAHDSAVTMTSLLGAVAAKGAHATVVPEPRAPALTGGVAAPLAAVQFQRLLLVAAIVLLLPIIGTLSPNLAKNHLLMPIVLSLVWAVVVARTFRRRT